VKTFQIAVLPGDGIGAEVTDEALKILRVVEARMTGVRFEIAHYAVGAGAYRSGQNPLPESTLAACREADAVLLGAMGLPDVRWPDGKEIAPQLDLREQLDLYCGVRPIRLYHEADTPLKRYRAGEIDLVIVRESTEGLFSTRLAKRQDGAQEVLDELKVTRSGSERLFRAAFRIAGQRRKRLTLIDKANVLPSMVFFREVFDAVARDSPTWKRSGCTWTVRPCSWCSVRRSSTCWSRRTCSATSCPIWPPAWSAGWGWPRPPTSATTVPCSSRRTVRRPTSPGGESPTPLP
jgi:3-isopropylmalate dehydrogenase